MSIAGELKSAIIAIDVQQGLVDRMGFGLVYVGKIAEALDHARSIGATVIHARLAFRPEAPEVSPANKALYRFSQSGLLADGAPFSLTHEGVGKLDSEITVTRSRTSAFHDSGLETILRSRAIRDLVILGNATSMGVLATVLDAADLDYSITVIGDCCIDPDQQSHQFVLERIFPRVSTVLSLSDWKSSR